MAAGSAHRALPLEPARCCSLAIAGTSAVATFDARLGLREDGLHKVMEVLLGCVMGLVVSWMMSQVWPMPEAQVKAA
jgi:hypothetical protein